MIAKPLWAILGFAALAIGAIGIVVPFLPTVPFLLLAGVCFARSSAGLHHWLLAHPVFGPPIESWRARGAIPRRAKILASLSVAAALAISCALGFGWKLIAAQAIALVGVMIFIWTRPD